MSSFRQILLPLPIAPRYNIAPGQEHLDLWLDRSLQDPEHLQPTPQPLLLSPLKA
ncbi:MAG: hypothetical protein ACOC43_14885 [Desulfohalobiaceae bacterium]